MKNIRVDIAFHQRVNAAAAEQTRAGCGRLLFRPGRRDSVRVNRKTDPIRLFRNLIRIADQERLDQPARLGVAHGFEHRLLLGANNADAQGRQILCQREEIVQRFQCRCHR